MDTRDRQSRGPEERGNDVLPGADLAPSPRNKGMDAYGFKEGKLFTTPDRATLTFFMGNEVASIHFDIKRQEIFFKGHNVKNMTLSQEQWLALSNFAKLMKQEGCASQMVLAYQECLNQVLPRFR